MCAQRYNVDTLIVVDDAGRYAGTVSIADIRLNGHVVTDIAPLVRTATPTVHSGDDAKGCFEQLISSGASYLVVLAGLAYILYYALFGSKNVNRDIPVND